MSDIPRARALTLEAALRVKELDPKAAALLRRAEVLMWREKANGKAPMACDPVTPAKVREVKRLLRLYPKATQFEIGRMVNLNPGRISEIKNGKRNGK